MLCVIVHEDVGDVGRAEKRLDRPETESFMLHVDDQPFLFLPAQGHPFFDDQRLDHDADLRCQLPGTQQIELGEIDPVDKPAMDVAFQLLKREQAFIGLLLIRTELLGWHHDR